MRGAKPADGSSCGGWRADPDVGRAARLTMAARGHGAIRAVGAAPEMAQDRSLASPLRRGGRRR
jgi:hypothetical protein